MFLFESIPWYSWAMFGVVLVALIALNEVTRRWKWAGLAFFVALPIILTAPRFMEKPLPISIS